jgi:DUF1009 family protein
MAELGKLGILAGGGELPGRLIERCRAEGRPVFVVGIAGHVDADLPTDAVLRIGAVGDVLRVLNQAKISSIVMAGRVARPRWQELVPDLAAMRLLWRWLFSGDDGLLRAVVRIFEEQGWRVAGIDEFLPELLAPPGILSAKAPSEEEWRDIRLGFTEAKALGAKDLGQAVVVRNGQVVGEEDRSGTDALIKRAKGHGGVLVKAMKPGQERRVDLPAVGVRTVENAAAAGLSGIAVEAGNTLIAERQAVIAAADRLGLFLVGLGAEDGC